MNGSTFRRCGCRDKNGRQLGRACPALAKRDHGTAGFAVWLETTAGRRQLRRIGYRTKTEAGRALEHVRDLVKVGGDDEASRRRIGDLLFDRSRRGGDLPTVDELRRRLGASDAINRSMTTGEWLEQWLAGRRGLRASTRRSYRGHLDGYLIPHLGHVPLDRLRTVHIAAMFDAVSASDRSISPATMHRIRATLRSALTAALRQGYVHTNVASHVELPTSDRPRVTPWQPEDLGRFLDAIGHDRLAAYYELAAATGLRRGEALALRWDDVDLELGTVVVRRQLVEVGRTVIAGRPKTRSGEDRVIELDATTVGMLLAHRLRQDAERAAWGSAWQEIVALPDEDGRQVELRGLLFTREDGTYVRPNYATKHFADLARAAGLPPVRLHDLRHGRASLLLAAGVDLAIVSKLLGHSSLVITADTYSHLLRGVGRKAAEAAAALVPRRPAEHTMSTQGTHAAGNDASADVFPQVSAVGRQGLEP